MEDFKTTYKEPAKVKSVSIKKIKKSKNNLNRVNEKYYHMMILPALAFLILFNIVPLGGIVIAFQRFIPAKGLWGSPFVGLENFRMLFLFPDVGQVLFNTVFIATFKIILGIIVPVVFSLLLNETKIITLKRIVQTIVYLPHFLSWIILAVMFNNILSYTGIVNTFLSYFGFEPKLFMISNTYFRSIIIITDVWKTFGFNAVIYLAAITSISPSLYEAAEIDGASRLQKIFYITLPSILPTIILMATLSLGHVLNAGFEQIFAMATPLVYPTSDIIDTYVYRMGLVNLQFSFATAVGLLKSLVSFGLMGFSYYLADRFAGYRIF